jgi:hypothetical protein
LHPTLELTLPLSSLSPPAQNCYLHTYLTLSSPLFIDRYPLSDPLFLASHNLKALHSLSGATDLEAPDWVTSAWGSAALFEIASSSPSDKIGGEDVFKVSIPLHLRYLTPTNSKMADGLRKHPVPNPIVFWACTAESGTQFTTSPFDRRNLGYDGLFGERTMFYHFNPEAGAPNGRSPSSSSSLGNGGMVTYIDIPVLDLQRTGAWVVEWGTVAVIAMGSVWVCWALARVLMRDFTGQGKQKKTERKEK